MGITPGGVHDESAGVRAHSLSKRLWPVFHDDVAPAKLAGNGSIKRRSIEWIVAVLEFGNDDFVFEARFALT